jgi:hypothetical protein
MAVGGGAVLLVSAAAEGRGQRGRHLVPDPLLLAHDSTLLTNNSDGSC